MKRSEINAHLREAIALLEEGNFHLPPWAFWTPDDWAAAGHEADEIRQRALGWDLTDFGSGAFDRCGLVLFTLRNGPITSDLDAMTKDYCEKIMVIKEGQITPTHFHWQKMEDIINRSGGRLVIELWNGDRSSEQVDEGSEVTVSIDGLRRTVPAGGKVVLSPGESICLTPYLYHKFYAEAGSGAVLAGEVSRVNDDEHDNRFCEPLPRFPDLEEDEPPLHLLCTEYPPAE
jgi:D-lyxose ketol-isomerase